MSNALDSIKQGLDEALDFAQGKKTRAVVHEFTPVDVKNIRGKVGMSQNEFASAFGISVRTLRNWESGDSTPHGPALFLLKVAAKKPKLLGFTPKTRKRDSMKNDYQP